MTFLTTGFSDLQCLNCKKEYFFSVPMFVDEEKMLLAFQFCRDCRDIIQPERSKREDSQ